MNNAPELKFKLKRVLQDIKDNEETKNEMYQRYSELVTEYENLGNFYDAWNKYIKKIRNKSILTVVLYILCMIINFISLKWFGLLILILSFNIPFEIVAQIVKKDAPELIKELEDINPEELNSDLILDIVKSKREEITLYQKGLEEIDKEIEELYTNKESIMRNLERLESYQRPIVTNDLDLSEPMKLERRKNGYRREK